MDVTTEIPAAEHFLTCLQRSGVLAAGRLRYLSLGRVNVANLPVPAQQPAVDINGRDARSTIRGWDHFQARRSLLDPGKARSIASRPLTHRRHEICAAALVEHAEGLADTACIT